MKGLFKNKLLFEYTETVNIYVLLPSDIFGSAYYIALPPDAFPSAESDPKNECSFTSQ